MTFSVITRLVVELIAVLLISLFLGFMPSSIAAETTTVKISPIAQNVSCGQNFSIDVVIEPHTAIAGAQFNLQFDPSLVQVNNVTEGNLFNQNGSDTIFGSGTIDNNTGIVKYVWGNILGAGENISSLGTFAIINFTAKTSDGVSPLNLITVEAISVKVSDPSGVAIPLNVENGSVNIQNCVINSNGVFGVQEFITMTQTSYMLLGILAIVSLVSLILFVLFALWTGIDINFITILVGFVALIGFFLLLYVMLPFFDAIINAMG